MPLEVQSTQSGTQPYEPEINDVTNQHPTSSNFPKSGESRVLNPQHSSSKDNLIKINQDSSNIPSTSKDSNESQKDDSTSSQKMDAPDNDVSVSLPQRKAAVKQRQMIQDKLDDL